MKLTGLLPLLLFGLLCAAGCRQQQVITCKANQGYDHKLGICYDCPAGTKADHKSATCRPVADTDGGGREEDLGRPDEEVADRPDESSPPDEQTPPPDEVTETAGGDAAAPGAVGAPCSMDMDCDQGLTCLDWPDGYCLKPDCKVDEECPAGAFCLPLIENALSCFDGCAGDADCRPGYGCKSIVTAGGESRSICHPIGKEELKMGQSCQEHSECSGSLACLQLGPQAMCTMSGCSAFSPCPEGSQCLAWGTMTICLPACLNTAACVELTGSQLFSCQELKDIEGQKQWVCSSTAQGLAVGELCYFPTECATGYCHLLVSGYCSGPDGSECATDADCPAGLCIANPGAQRGVCSRPCGSGDPCPADSFCINTIQGSVCMATCENKGEPCGPPGFGMVCAYGTLVYPPAPAGKYACVPFLGGEAGTACQKAGDCASGICYGEAAGSGYCATACATNADCPFGTLCLTGALVEGQTYCTRICYHDLDCLPGFTCKNTFYQEKGCLL